MAGKLSADAFRQQLGPFVLVQRPENEVASGAAAPGMMKTMTSRPSKVSSGALSLLFQFDDLVVATLPPLQGVDKLSVGRQPDCDLVLDDPSVSKVHATLRWAADESRCTIEDLSSTNGTFLNASVRLKHETTLKDGDILSFGEVQYWFLLTKTLHDKLTRKAQRDIGV
jgi:pSer/pThr/pTyr-binding forkhead associated (FHA) protein